MIKDSVNTELSNRLMLNYLKSVQSLSMIIRQINKVLSVLSDKRATVAEKAIQEELIFCGELESFFLYLLSKALKQKCFCISENDCLKLRRINIKLNKQLQAFIKAAKYNLNYLEQYFEHDFWLQFTSSKFAEQLSDIKGKIEFKKH